MAGYACQWCDWIPDTDDDELTNQQKFALLTGHQREGHPDEMRARMGTKKATSEQITLPGELFVLFHWVKAQFPDYEATKGEWLQHVVATWAIDHGEEIKLPSIPGVFINNALELQPEDEEIDEDEEELEDAEAEESDPLATWYTRV